MLLQCLNIVLLLFISQTKAEKCTTPDNKEGECISLYSCPSLLDAIASRQNSSIDFVRKSSCWSCGLEQMVCCKSSSNDKTVSGSVSTVVSHELIPTRRYCGLQHSDDYFHAENGTGIDEFPWLAALMYKDKNSTLVMVCAGSLISNRYILTSASCLKFSLYQLVMVRLGEHNVETQVDCTESSRYEKDCTEQPKNYDIEKVILHPNYTEAFLEGNLALLRLNATVTYSDFIRPICLPTPGMNFAQIGDILYTSGWGLINIIREQTVTKKKVLTKLISNEECKSIYPYFTKSILEEHFCVRELDNNKEYLCVGDGGVPIMFSVRNQWYLEGVAWFNVGCGEIIPVRSTKVAYYWDWIVGSIEP